MRANVILSGVTITVSFVFLVFSFRLPGARSTYMLGPDVWPKIILSLLLLMGVVLLVQTIREKKPPASGQAPHQSSSRLFKQTWIMAGGIFLYILLTQLIGFMLATLLYTFAAVRLLGYKRLPLAALFSLISTGCLSYLFLMVMNIAMPRGMGIFREMSFLFY